MRYIQAIPRTSKIVLALSLVLGMLTIAILGKSVGLMLACVVSIVVGMAMFLKSKDIGLRVAGGILFTIGLLWLLVSPFWLHSGLPTIDPFATPVPSLMPPE